MNQAHSEASAATVWGHVEQWLTQYEAMGPFMGVAVPLSESFLPFLPLVALIVANVNAYGFWEGLFLSWLGVVLGSISVFWLSRRFGTRFRGLLERRLPGARKLIEWVEKRGFTPIFVLACFPFTPSSIVNIVSGISRIPAHAFITATALGKGVMIFLVSVAGQDVGNLLRHPWKLELIVVVFALMWLVGRRLERRYLKG